MNRNISDNIKLCTNTKRAICAVLTRATRPKLVSVIKHSNPVNNHNVMSNP